MAKQMYEEALGPPPAYCDHRPPKVGTIRTDDGKVQVQCLTCGTMGPERDGPGEAFLALLATPYRLEHGEIGRTCITSNRRMKGVRGALAARAAAGLWPPP